MFDRTDDDRDRDRGQVGIGTLIVFIAMVLVAAIAAGVLINTAGFLQSSAEQSGEQAAEQTTNRLVEVNTVGEIGEDDDNDVVEEVDMTVRLASGSDDVDLEDTTIQWVTAGSSSSLVAMEEGSDDLEDDKAVEGSPEGVFYWNTLRDEDGSIEDDYTLNEQSDRAIITFNLTDEDYYNANLNPLEPGDTADITISTRAGGETTVTLVVPDSVSGKTSVSL